MLEAVVFLWGAGLIMNPLAKELNSVLVRGGGLEGCGESLFKMLSIFGKELFFPKGILAQAQEAKERADKFDATIGIALDRGKPFVLSGIEDRIDTSSSDFSIKDIVSYAPVAGKAELRALWKEGIFLKNPSLTKDISMPVVTSGITHGLSIFSDLFLDAEDSVILPDKFWGNYRLIFALRNRAILETFPMFTEEGGFNVRAFESLLCDVLSKKDKAVVLFNFPNNPTGYTLNEVEALELKRVILEQASLGKQIMVLMDDSYFGLFYEDSIKESLFSYFTGLHENVLAIKLDAGTKEDYVWGFRTGFITYGLGSGSDEVYRVLEEKTKGAIRSYISNSPHISQTLLLAALKDENYIEEKLEKFVIMRDRALRLKEVLRNPRYESAWDVYPFNSGYFMCLLIKDVKAEDLRVHLLDKYGVGVISTGEYDLRVAFSCVEYEDIEKLFEVIYQGVCDLQDRI